MTSTFFKALAATAMTMCLLQGCSNMNLKASSGSAPSTLDGTAWISGSPGGAAQAPGPRATLRFEGGRVQGSDGCNRYSAGYTAAQGKLSIEEPRISTQMACPEEDQAQMAMAFNRSLDEVRGYRIESGELVFLDASGATLAYFVAQATTLAGTAWQIHAHNNGKQAVVGVIAGTQPTLEFGADGKLQGSGGCNRFNGSYTEEGKALRIGRLASTRMACAEPAGRMTQEAQVLAALESAATAQREGDTLELRTASGALAVSARLATPAKP